MHFVKPFPGLCNPLQVLLCRQAPLHYAAACINLIFYSRQSSHKTSSPFLGAVGHKNIFGSALRYFRFMYRRRGPGINISFLAEQYIALSRTDNFWRTFISSADAAGAALLHPGSCSKDTGNAAGTIVMLPGAPSEYC